MSDQNGVKSNNIDPAALLDDFLANRSGSTVRVPIEAAATQLLSTGPFQLLTNASKLFPTFAALAVAGISDMTPWVYADPDPAKNGIYRAVAGVWTWSLPLPYSFIKAVNNGAGTGSNIQATTPIPVSEMTLIILPIAEVNDTSPVTVSYNGGAPLTVKSNSGNDISEGGLVPPMNVTGVISGSEFHIVSDQVAAAVVAAAEAWAQDARTSANSAAASAALSGKYAANPEDAEVTAGSGIFSAFHWYRKTLALYNSVAAGIAGMIHGAPEKVSLEDTDEFLVLDSSSGSSLKKFVGLNLVRYLGLGLNIASVSGCEATYVSGTSVQMKAGAVVFKGKRVVYGAPLTKQLNAQWAAGDNAGFIETGVMQASKAYFVHAIRNIATGAGDWIASLQALSSSVVPPAGWEVLGRTDVVLTTSGNVIRQFTKAGNILRWVAGIDEVSIGSAVAATLIQPVAAPAGIPTRLMLMLVNNTNANSSTGIYAATDLTGIPEIDCELNVQGAVSIRINGICQTRSDGKFAYSTATPQGTGSWAIRNYGFDDYTVPRRNGA